MSFNRRSFLKNTTAAAGSLFLPALSGYASVNALHDDVSKAVAKAKKENRCSTCAAMLPPNYLLFVWAMQA